MQVIPMNRLIVLGLLSTLMKSVMEVTVIVKLTDGFFSPRALHFASLGPVLLLFPVRCYLAFYSFCFFLLLTSTAANGWLFFPRAVASRNTALEQRPSTGQSSKGGP